MSNDADNLYFFRFRCTESDKDVLADGRLARIWRNVRVDGHADEVLEAVRAM